MDLSTRVAQLEMESRRSRRLAVVAIGVSALSVLMAHVQTTRGAEPAVEAQRFVVKDASGKTRATFGMIEDSPVLGIMSGGQVAALVTAGPDGGVVQTSGPHGAAALVMSPKGGMVVLNDAADRERTLVTVEGVSLHGASGKRLDASWNRKGLVLLDDQQRERIQLLSRGDNTGLALFDTAGKMQAGLVVNAGKPNLFMTDATGQLITR